MERNWKFNVRSQCTIIGNESLHDLNIGEKVEIEGTAYSQYGASYFVRSVMRPNTYLVAENDLQQMDFIALTNSSSLKGMKVLLDTIQVKRLLRKKLIPVIYTLIDGEFKQYQVRNYNIRTDMFTLSWGTYDLKLTSNQFMIKFNLYEEIDYEFVIAD